MTVTHSPVNTQCARILSHLRAGRTLTAREALDLFDCMRLGARVHELNRDGHDIRSRLVATAEGKHVAQYHIPQS